MTPEQQRSESSSPSIPLDGEIVALEDDCVRVRLESGTIGVLATGANGHNESSFSIGQHRQFQILRRDANGDAILSLVAGQDSATSPAFEHDVDELQSALTNHRTPPLATRSNGSFPTLDEQRIQQWLNRVEKNLTKLRRNRAKRLDEEFYSG